MRNPCKEEENGSTTKHVVPTTRISQRNKNTVKQEKEQVPGKQEATSSALYDFSTFVVNNEQYLGKSSTENNQISHHQALVTQHEKHEVKEKQASTLDRNSTPDHAVTKPQYVAPHEAENQYHSSKKQLQESKKQHCHFETTDTPAYHECYFHQQASSSIASSTNTPPLEYCDGSSSEESLYQKGKGMVPTSSSQHYCGYNHQPTTHYIHQYHYSGSLIRPSHDYVQPVLQDHTTIEQDYSKHLNENDVLCGRGRNMNSYIGNINFRALLMEYQDKFFAGATRYNKQRIILEIITKIKSKGGRFLERPCKGIEKGLWKNVEESKAMIKTDQALRDLASRAEKDESDSGTIFITQFAGTGTTHISKSSKRELPVSKGEAGDESKPRKKIATGTIPSDIQLWAISRRGVPLLYAVSNKGMTKVQTTQDMRERKIRHT